MTINSKYVVTFILGLAAGVGFVTLIRPVATRIPVNYAEGYVLSCASDWTGVAIISHSYFSKGDSEAGKKWLEELMYQQVFYDSLLLDKVEKDGLIDQKYADLQKQVEIGSKYLREHHIPSTMRNGPYQGPPHPLVSQGLNAAEYVEKVISGEHRWKVKGDAGDGKKSRN